MRRTPTHSASPQRLTRPAPSTLTRHADSHHRRGGDARPDVQRAAEQAGHETVLLAARAARYHRRRTPSPMRSRRRPTSVINCAAWTDVDGAESAPRAGARPSTAPGAGNVAAAADAAGRMDRSRLHRLRVQRRQARALRGVRSRSARSRPMAAPSSTASGRWPRRRPERHTIVRTAWLFGAGGTCFPKTILRAASQRPELTVVADQIGCPTFTGHLADGAGGAGRAAHARRPARRRSAASAPGMSSPPRSSTRPAWTARCARSPPTSTRARAAPGQQRPDLRARRPGAARLARRAGAVHVRARGGARMKLLVCGAAGFIGSTFVELRVREHGDEVTVLDALTYAGRRGEPPRGRVRDPLRPGRDRGSRGGGRRRSATPRRSSTSPPRPTSTARSPTRSRSASPTARAPTCCSRPRASAGCATCRSPPTRSTARSRRARSPRPRRCSRPAPTARPRPAPTCSSPATSTPTGWRRSSRRGSNNYGPRQYPEKLIPLMILNALAGDHLPVYGDGRNVRNWLYVEDFGRGIGHVLAHGKPGEIYNCGGPDECENLEVVHADPGVDRSRRVADRVRHRPARPRPPLLAVLRQAGRAGLAGADAVRRRPGAHRRRGTGTTPGGGSRSARAPTASTTSATTAAR